MANQQQSNHTPAVAGNLTPQQRFSKSIEKYSHHFLVRMVGERRAAEAEGRIVNAIGIIAQSNPKVMECEPGSIAQCVAMSVFTNLMPGGVKPAVYLIPREVSYKNPDRSAPPNKKWLKKQVLCWQMGYRGYQRLAERDGFKVVAVAISFSDVCEIADSDHPHYEKAVELTTTERMYVKRDIDHPPMEWSELRGVMVYATEKATGNVQAAWVARSVIEKRLRKGETYKQALDTIARKLENKPTDKSSRDYWNSKPSADGLAKAEAFPVEEVLAQIKGPWADWGIEMCQKTALINAMSNGLVPLSDESSWATKADAFADEQKGALGDDVPIGPSANDVPKLTSQSTTVHHFSDDDIPTAETYEMGNSGMEDLMAEDQQQGKPDAPEQTNMERGD